MKQRPFSKLKKQIENLFAPELGMEFCCSSYRVKTNYSEMQIPRFYVKIGKDIVWDFPKDFEQLKKVDYRVWIDRVDICELVRNYVDTPVEKLMSAKFEGDGMNEIINYLGQNKHDIVNVEFKLTELFKAADRRIGKQKLLDWERKINNPVVNRIVEKRFDLPDRKIIVYWKYCPNFEKPQVEINGRYFLINTETILKPMIRPGQLLAGIIGEDDKINLFTNVTFRKKVIRHDRKKFQSQP